MARRLNAAQQQAVFAIQRGLGVVRYEAIMGDGLGHVSDLTSNGFNVLVRYQTANNLGWPQSVRKPPGNVSYAQETPVWVGYNDDGELAVLGPRILAQKAAGTNGIVNDVQNDPTGGFLDLSLALQLRSQPTSPPSLSVTVKSLWYIHNGVPVNFPGDGDLPLDGFIPDTGKQCLALAYLDTSDNTMHVVASTPISIARGMSAFGTGDIEECVAAAGINAIYSKFWWVPYSVAAFGDECDYLDFRLWLMSAPAESYATLQTTDDTETTLASIPVAELQMMTITATINGVKDDYSAAIGGIIPSAVVRRASGDDATLVGSITPDSHEDSGGSPSFTLDVDTTSQTARIRVTGVDAETWNWTAKFQTLAS